MGIMNGSSSITTANYVFLIGLLALMVHVSLAQNSAADYVRAHNTARAQVNVGPVSWDDKLATYARNYANKHKGDCKLVHSGGPYGENLAGSSADLTGTAAVR
ncbi:Pathogenesis-related protein 1 [Quillaja saponaria]|uniref:Pathogenesis-related protein 1 n=1 Tax=Quillaja saponaria TaxID=32244 RepID=A0AAD7P9M8_QUISA|nr:Pathogenesis-related protein 1 [Quillaja saponaria]